MSILQITTSTTGLVGVTPRVIYINTNDTQAAVLAVGYLNLAVQQGYTFNDSDMALVTTKTSPSAATTQVEWLEVSHVGTNWSLVPAAGAGNVVLPTIANHIATYVNTTGGLSEDSATAINGGNIQAGLSGTAGFLASFPATAARGSLRLVGANSAGNTVTQITNASQAAARVYTIPDGGQAASNFLLTDSAGTQTIATGSLALTLGNITAAAGAISATLGAVSAGTTVTAGTGITATTGNITASTGNFVSTLGSVSAATTVTAGTGITATTGNITASAGNVVAGASGAAGTVSSFPTTAARGSLILAGVANAGNTNVTISNASHGQASVYSIPDVGAATGQFNVVTGALVSGNSLVASGTAGKLADAGYAIKTVAAAPAAGGSATQNFVDAFCTAGSNVIGNWNTQANAASVLKITPGVGSFNVVSTADAGVGTFNYIITK